MPVSTRSPAARITHRGLAEWLERSEADERELIVEADLPRRRVRLGRSAGGPGVVLKGIEGAPVSRQAILDELGAFAAGLLEQPPTVLRSAGALAVRVTPAEARQLAEHPLVRAIRPNRALRLRGAG